METDESSELVDVVGGPNLEPVIVKVVLLQPDLDLKKGQPNPGLKIGIFHHNIRVALHTEHTNCLPAPALLGIGTVGTKVGTHVVGILRTVHFQPR